MGKISFVIVPPKLTTTPRTTTKAPPTLPRTTTRVGSNFVTRSRSICEQFGNQHCDQLCVDNPEKWTFTCECYEGYERKNGRCVQQRNHVSYTIWVILYELEIKQNVIKVFYKKGYVKFFMSDAGNYFFENPLVKILFSYWDIFLIITKITCEELQCGVRSSGHPFCKTNPNGDATCQCLPGYKKIDNNQCVDIDECNHPDPYSQSLKK